MAGIVVNNAYRKYRDICLSALAVNGKETRKLLKITG